MKKQSATFLLCVIEGRWVPAAILLSLSMVLTGCSILTGQPAGPIEETLISTGAGVLAVVDWLLASETLPPEMAEKLSSWFTSVNTGLERTSEVVTELKSTTITTEGATYGAGAIATGLLGLIRLWRGGASKGVVSTLAESLRKARDLPAAK